jgi:predicted  nucleic acid-binding Zn-ribbon protein
MAAEADVGADERAQEQEGPADAQGRANEADQAADGDLQRVQRGLRNLAFVLERDRARVEETMAGLRAELAGLRERIEGAEPAAEPSGGDVRRFKRELRDLSRELKEDRKLVETSVGELRERLEGAARSDDVAALRKEVAELAEGGKRAAARERRRRKRDRGSTPAKGETPEEHSGD